MRNVLGVVVFNRVVKGGLMEKVTFEQILGGGAGRMSVGVTHKQRAEVKRR